MIATPNLLGFNWSWELDGWIMVTGMLAAVAASLPGNFLVLRKMSMLGDAITHAVLPGIAVAFLVTESRSSVPMFVGAVVVGVITALFTEWIRGFGGVDEGASMGVVFTSLFALGLLMLVQAADSVDLDPDCVLYGAIETTPLDRISIFSWEVPRAAAVLTIVMVINAAFVTFFFKELMISSFDPALATTMGFSSKWIHYGLMVLVSVTAVACFESVGSILVVAMFVVPAASAYMLTDRLGWMIAISVVLAMVSAVSGHLMALTIPTWFGFRSTTTAGMIAVAAGCLFVIAAAFGPTHGVLVKYIRRRGLAVKILCDDVVALLFRWEETDQSSSDNAESVVARVRSPEAGGDSAAIADRLFSSRIVLAVALFLLRHRGEISVSPSGDGRAIYQLTDVGRERARRLVRSHRLWEQYLVDQVGRDAEQIHDKAERFEHFTDRELRERLASQTDRPELDPHGKPIPEES